MMLLVVLYLLLESISGVGVVYLLLLLFSVLLSSWLVLVVILELCYVLL